jgi:spore photoproduct lyase
MTHKEKLALLSQEKPYGLLDSSDRSFFEKLEGLSYQNLRLLMLMIIDLKAWQAAYRSWLTLPFSLHAFKKNYEDLRHTPLKPHKNNVLTQVSLENRAFPSTILGLCPVNSEKTRCCQLKTLDVVQGCGFSCVYCAIPTFYGGGNRVTRASNLEAILEGIELEPDKYHHIGTGQASDSLLYLSADDAALLVNFARRHPHMILELKSKSAAVEHFMAYDTLPQNMLFTWSLNPQVAIEAWEAGSASLEERLNAAEKISRKAKIGFHLHPMIPFENYQKHYTALIGLLTQQFDPKRVVTVSFGTLTFSKTVLKHLRLSQRHSNILQLPLEECAGKFSLPLKLKEEMFSTLFQAFKAAGWHKEVYFYLCMEEKELWHKVFGREYADNDAFEKDMLTFYFKKCLHIDTGFRAKEAII